MRKQKEIHIDYISQERDKGKSFSAIAADLGVDRRTISRRYKALQPMAAFDYSQFKPLLRTGDCMITMDWHIPLHDQSMIDKLLEIASCNNIRTLIVNGDFFHFDSFSSFLPRQKEATIAIEKPAANRIANSLLAVFDDIVFTAGNHDFRFSKYLGFAFSYEDSIKMILDQTPLDNFHISSLDYMIYRSKDKIFRVCHPKDYSSIPLTVARKLQPKYGCSIITGHSHHCALGVALDGRNLIMDGGGFFDKGATEYIQKTTTHHEWVQGFIMFRNGVPTLYSPAFGNI